MRLFVLFLLLSPLSAELLGGLLGGLTGNGGGGGLLGGLTGSVSSTLGGLSNTVGGVVGGVTNVVSNVLSGLTNLVASLGGHVTGLFDGIKIEPVALDAISSILDAAKGTIASPAGAVAATAKGEAAEIIKLLPNVSDAAVKAELYWLLTPDFIKAPMYIHQMFSSIPTIATADQTKLKDAFVEFSSTKSWAQLRGKLFVLAPKLGEAIEHIYGYYIRHFDKFTHKECKEIQVTCEGQEMLAVVAAVTGASDYSGIDFSSAVARYQALSDEAKTEYRTICPEIATGFEVDSVKNLVTTYWSLLVLEKAKFAATFVPKSAYSSFEQLISDANALSPAVGIQISAVGNYFVQQLKAKAVTEDQITQLKTNLAGALLQILQAEPYYKPNDNVNTVANLLGVSSKIVYGVLNTTSGAVTPFTGDLDVVGGPLMDAAKVMSRLSGEL